jgi:Ni/Co efflux regulator RcnB
MKLLPIARLVALTTLGLASAAFADDNDRRDRRDSRDQRSYDHQGDNERGERGRGRHHQQHHRHFSQRDFDAHGSDYRRGGYLPPQFRGRTYIINDYRPYRLSPPPRGHQWVQVGADYVLVAIATGIIANIILNQ